MLFHSSQVKACILVLTELLTSVAGTPFHGCRDVLPSTPSSSYCHWPTPWHLNLPNNKTLLGARIRWTNWTVNWWLDFCTWWIERISLFFRNASCDACTWNLWRGWSFWVWEVKLYETSLPHGTAEGAQYSWLWGRVLFLRWPCCRESGGHSIFEWCGVSHPSCAGLRVNLRFQFW